MWRTRAIFKFFKLNFEYGAIFKLTKAYLNWRFFKPNLHIRLFFKMATKRAMFKVLNCF